MLIYLVFDRMLWRIDRRCYLWNRWWSDHQTGS